MATPKLKPYQPTEEDIKRNGPIVKCHVWVTGRLRMGRYAKPHLCNSRVSGVCPTCGKYVCVFHKERHVCTF